MQLVLCATMLFIALVEPAANQLIDNHLAAKIIVNQAASPSLSVKCSSSLAKVRTYLNSSSNPSETFDVFYSAFGEGKSNELITDSRFEYRMLLCFKVAGETDFSVSEFPTSFCYRYDLQQYGSTAHTICIPTPCLQDEQKLWNTYEEIWGTERVRTNGSISTCIRSRRERQWYQKALPLLALSYILLLWLIVATSTVYHVQRGSQTRSLKGQIFLAFSAKRNIKMLYKMKRNRSTTITCMFGIRFLTLLWIVIGHTFAWIAPYIDNVTEFYHDIADNFANQWISNFLLTVDVFLVLGGTVNAYGFFQKFEKMKSKPTWRSFTFWINFYLHRIVRLWPAYFYTLIGVLFLSNTYYRAMWPEIDPTVQCAKYWWQNLLLIASLFEHRCMGWAWYISTEFIFYLVSPLFLLAFARSQYLGYMLSMLCIGLSDAARVHVMLAYNMPPTQLGWNTPPIFNANFMEHFVAMYIKPQYRVAPYIIGLCLGYYLAKIQAKKHNDVHHSKTFIAIGWVISVLCAVCATCGLYPVLSDLNWRIYYLVYGALHRTIFALAVAWLLYACHTGYGGFINTFLSWKFFLPLSALCYSVYLSHMPVIFASYLQLPFPYTYTTKCRILLGALVNAFVAYVLGFQCSMLSEFPALNIERSIRHHIEKKEQNIIDNKAANVKMSSLLTNC